MPSGGRGANVAEKNRDKHTDGEGVAQMFAALLLPHPRGSVPTLVVVVIHVAAVASVVAVGVGVAVQKG